MNIEKLHDATHSLFCKLESTMREFLKDGVDANAWKEGAECGQIGANALTSVVAEFIINSVNPKHYDEVHEFFCNHLKTYLDTAKESEKNESEI